MDKKVNQVAWRRAVEQHVQEDLGGIWKCEVCGKELTPQTAIGHHKIIPRAKTSECASWNVEIRCKVCEREDPHDVAKGKVSLPMSRFCIGEVLAAKGQLSESETDAEKSDESTDDKPQTHSRFAVPGYNFGRAEAEKDNPQPNRKVGDCPSPSTNKSRFGTAYEW